MDTIIYSDLSRTPESQELAKNLDSVYQSLHNILSTRKGERLFLPDFGCDLDDALFELMDDDTAFLIYEIVLEAISKWEPRVTLQTSKVIPNYDTHSYDVTLVFTVAGFKDQHTFKESIGG